MRDERYEAVTCCHVCCGEARSKAGQQQWRTWLTAWTRTRTRTPHTHHTTAETIKPYTTTAFRMPYMRLCPQDMHRSSSSSRRADTYILQHHITDCKTASTVD